MPRSSRCAIARSTPAANDLDAWVAVLADGVVLTRPSHDADAQRLEGPKTVRKFAMKAGGLRELVHLEAGDRVVGTVSNDCRRCRRAFVAFQANTRSGTMVVSLDLGTPSSIQLVEIGSDVRRRRLGTARDDDAPSTAIVPPAKTEARPTTKTTDEPARPAPVQPALKPAQ